MSSERVDAALALLRTEYLETSTLLLTVGEAAELLDLNRTPRPWLFCKRWRTRVFWAHTRWPLWPGAGPAASSSRCIVDIKSGVRPSPGWPFVLEEPLQLT